MKHVNDLHRQYASNSVPCGSNGNGGFTKIHGHRTNWKIIELLPNDFPASNEP